MIVIFSCRSLAFIYFHIVRSPYSVNDIILVYLACFLYFIKFIPLYYGGGFGEGVKFESIITKEGRDTKRALL